jgi:NADPH:quinone reductase-like Zn-dependent oxidoreductase
MRAAVCTRYGPAEVIQIAEVEKPAPNENEVLIRIRATALNPLDGGLLKGRPYFVRLMTGLRKPKNARPGVDLAGEVEAIGRNVTRFKPGDSVFGVCTNNPKASGAEAWVHRLGAFAEYVCAPESALAVKPENVTFEQAASMPVAAFTAWLRDKAQVKPDQKVLVNGASGGVGTFAVQIAKAFGAAVTGVCSTRNLDMVRSSGQIT